MDWLKWSETPLLKAGGSNAELVRTCEQMLLESADSIPQTEFQTRCLAAILGELSTQWGAILVRNPDWRTQVEVGRKPQGEMPWQFLEETLDRDSAGWLIEEQNGAMALIAVRIPSQDDISRVLVLKGRKLVQDDRPASLALSRTLGLALDMHSRNRNSEKRIERLEETLVLTASLAQVHDTVELLELLAKHAVDLLQCDRASIFLWDKEQNEVVACPAIGVEGNTLRIPDNKGIVGEVIHSGESVRVDDAYADDRFDRRIDKETGYTTRSLLCVPINNQAGERIGAFEVMNKQAGAFTSDDDCSLRELGLHAAAALQSVGEREALAKSHRRLTEQVSSGIHIIGESPAIAGMRSTIERLAATDLPVLVLGESGTGKEVVSQALHYQGTRAEKPFIAVNCAALTESLLESELFGHDKGAFTDAQEDRQGKFELAHEGTIFLDEIGDMSLGGQAKLLRVLEQKTVTRVGGSKTIPVDVRVIAATNANLAESVQQKKFRQDLYYRLSVVTLELPALRDRAEDVLLLANFFLNQFCQQARRPVMAISAEAQKKLQSHHWPGNVRELRNLMERISFLAAGPKIEIDDIAFILSPQAESNEPSLDLGLTDATLYFQRDFIRKIISRVQGNMSEAARVLGLHRSNLYRKMKQLDMKEAGGEN